MQTQINTQKEIIDSGLLVINDLTFDINKNRATGGKKAQDFKILTFSAHIFFNFEDTKKFSVQKL